MQAKSMTNKKADYGEEEKRFGLSGFGKANPRHSFSSIKCVGSESGRQRVLAKLRNLKLETPLHPPLFRCRIFIAKDFRPLFSVSFAAFFSFWWRNLLGLQTWNHNILWFPSFTCFVWTMFQFTAGQSRIKQPAFAAVSGPFPLYLCLPALRRHAHGLWRWLSARSKG